MNISPTGKRMMFMSRYASMIADSNVYLTGTLKQIFEKQGLNPDLMSFENLDIPLKKKIRSFRDMSNVYQATANNTGIPVFYFGTYTVPVSFNWTDATDKPMDTTMPRLSISRLPESASKGQPFSSDELEFTRLFRRFKKQNPRVEVLQLYCRHFAEIRMFLPNEKQRFYISPPEGFTKSCYIENLLEPANISVEFIKIGIHTMNGPAMKGHFDMFITWFFEQKEQLKY